MLVPFSDKNVKTGQSSVPFLKKISYKVQCHKHKQIKSVETKIGIHTFLLKNIHSNKSDNFTDDFAVVNDNRVHIVILRLETVVAVLLIETLNGG